jgi:hypothetical protein
VLEQQQELLVVLLANFWQRTNLSEALQGKVPELGPRKQTQQDLKQVGVENIHQRNPSKVHLHDASCEELSAVEMYIVTI